jgi:hypothetical protein
VVDLAFCWVKIVGHLLEPVHGRLDLVEEPDSGHGRASASAWIRSIWWLLGVYECGPGADVAGVARVGFVEDLGDDGRSVLGDAEVSHLVRALATLAASRRGVSLPGRMSGRCEELVSCRRPPPAIRSRVWPVSTRLRRFPVGAREPRPASIPRRRSRWLCSSRRPSMSSRGSCSPWSSRVLRHRPASSRWSRYAHGPRKTIGLCCSGLVAHRPR